MPREELTARFCDTAKAVNGRKTDYFDTSTRGLCLRASAGGTKAYYLVYSKPDRSRAWLKLGTHPELTLAKARQKARDARAAVGDGDDPVLRKKALAATQTVAALVENYVARHASTKRSGNEIARRLRKNVSEVIGSIKLSELHRRDITRCVDAVSDRGAHVEANRMFEDLRAMIRWARGRGDLDQNLTEGMRKPTQTTPRDRALTADEIEMMWAKLATAEMRESTRRILRLCLLTAQRVGEVCGMTHDEVDLGRTLWTIPATRTKNGREHFVPLSTMSAAIIREQIAEVNALAKRKGRGGPVWIFPAPGSRAKVTAASIPKALKRIEAGVNGTETILGVAPFTPHDLRRSAATLMEEAGVSPFVVGHVLNHVSITKASITSRVYARYNYEKEKREALDILAARVAAIIEGRGGNVTPMRGEAVA